MFASNENVISVFPVQKETGCGLGREVQFDAIRRDSILSLLSLSVLVAIHDFTSAAEFCTLWIKVSMWSERQESYR